jgi:hypothetical protein
MFLFGLTGVFFLFLLFARQFKAETFQAGHAILIFYFVSFFFYAIAYSLRMIFPLMAKEGRATWHLFSLPIPRDSILHQKLLLSCFLILPYSIGGIILWVVAKTSYTVPLMAYSFLLTCGIAVMIACLGAIHPNFSESENAEKISTSAMGLVALGISLVTIAVAGYVLFLYSNGQNIVWLFLPVLLTGVVTGGFYLLAKKSVKQYQV